MHVLKVFRNYRKNKSDEFRVTHQEPTAIVGH